MNNKNYFILLAILGFTIILWFQFVGFQGHRSVSPSDLKEAGTAKKSDHDKDPTNKLRITVSMQQAEFDALQNLSAAYGQTHTGMAIDLENIPQKDAYTRFKKASQLGDASDIMLLDNSWVNEFAALGFLQPVDDFFTTEQQSQRIASMINQVKWNGYFWGIPKDIDPYIIAWNKKTAENYKLDHAPTTADEMLAWNKSMMHPEEGKFGLYLEPTDPYAFLSLAPALGTDWTDNGIPLHKINDAATIKTAESFFVPQQEAWNVKQFGKNYLVPSPNWNPWDLLENGKIGAMVTTLSEVKQHKSEEIKIASLPISAKGGSSNGGLLVGRSFVLSSRSKNNAVAMEWIKEMTSADTELKLWAEAGILPVHIANYQAASLRNDEFYNSFIWLINMGRVLPLDKESGKKLSSLQTEMQRMGRGEIDFKGFAEQLAKQWMPPNSGL